MATVTIGGETYQTYADVAEADAYYNGSITAVAAAWRAADADTKARGLVSATRWIDSIPADQWKPGYTTFAERLAVPAIVQACIILAGGLVSDPDMRSSFTQVGTRRLKAGSVEIEYFRGASVQVTTPFPTDIMLLLKPYLGAGDSDGTSAGGFGGSKSFGTDREDALKDGFDYTWGI